MPKILAIDDDPKNLMLIEGFLDDFEVTLAHDGIEGLEILKKNPTQFELILLDRMMPRMNGMEMLRKIQEDKILKTIPVIMQTAAAEKKQVLEGVQAGVFHYLTKPYDEEILRRIINSCLANNASQMELRNAVMNRKRMMGLIKSCYIEFKDIDEAHDVTTYIATLFPEPQKVVLGISELLINAIEHGNLGIKYDEKTVLQNNQNWKTEIKRLIALPENNNKVVRINYEYKNDGFIKLSIKDDGNGFDWKNFLELSPERAIDNHGRGIAMAKAISFDTIEYQGCGNEVICTIQAKKQTVLLK